MAGTRPEEEAGFTEAKRVRSWEDIVSQIREAVLSGRLKQGDRLASERALREIFGVSRSTLREALRTLEALRMIEIRPGSTGGIFVITPDVEHVAEALEALIRFEVATAEELGDFRLNVEGETAAWAALRADADDVARLEAIAADFVSTTPDDEASLARLVDLDFTFHEAVARASKNQVCLAIMLALHRTLLRVTASMAPGLTPEVWRNMGIELTEIAAAVRAKDPEAARAWMRTHIMKFRRAVDQLSIQAPSHATEGEA